MGLRKRAFALSIGLVWGLAILLGTWLLLFLGYEGTTTEILYKIYFGYTFSWIGGLIGFIDGFVYGFILGFLIAWFYELFSKMIYKTKQ